MADKFEPPKVWTGTKKMAESLQASTARLQARPMKRNYRAANIRCSCIRWPHKWCEGHHHAGRAARAGHDAEYDAYVIRIGDGEQFGSGFVAANPNSKIPALIDYSKRPADTGVRV